MRKVLSATIVIMLWIGSASPQKYMGFSVTNGGTISGKVTFAGTPPAAKKIVPDTDKATCGAHGPILSEDLVIDATGGVKNVLVTLTNITKGKPLLAENYAVLDQNGCVYGPHVMVVPLGQKIKVLNSDGILHNVHSHSVKNPPVNFAQPGSVKELEIKPYTIPELVKFTCDVHNWMSAYVWVSEHPYAVVTKPDGSYEIPDIPPGKYKVKFWHETLGEQVQEVKVDRGKLTKLDVTFPIKKK